MSKEQLIDPQTQQDASAPSADVEDPTYGLRPDLYAQLMQMGPGDVDAVADMLGNYPGLVGRILPVAAHRIGNSAVRRAIELQKQRMAVKGPQHQMADEDSRAMLRDETDDRSDKIGMKDMVATMSDPEQPQAAQPAAPEAHAAPAWVSGARKYNEQHPSLVSEFNELTNGICTGDDDIQLDPQAVAHWQAAHGVAADGKIGAHTLAAARQSKTKGTEIAETTQDDPRPPV